MPSIKSTKSPGTTASFLESKVDVDFYTLGAIALLIFASFLVLVGDSVIKVGLDLIVRLPVDTTGVNVLVTLWRLLSFPLALGLGTGIIAMVINILTSPPDRRHPCANSNRCPLV